MKLTTFGALTVALLAFGGCVRRLAAIAQESAPPALSGTATSVSLHVGDRDRTLLLYAPVDLPAKSALVVMLHGSGEDGSGFRKATGFAFDRLADEHRFAVAYLDGYKGNWDDCRKAATYPARAEHIDDEAFISAAIGRAVQQAGVDTKHVFVVGYSNGAQMAYRLALERPDLVAGIAAIAAGLPTADNLDCRPTGKPMPTVIVNGTADPLNPYAGGDVSLFGAGERGNVLSTEASAQYFATLNAQPGPPERHSLPHLEASDPTRVDVLSWNSSGNAPVVLYSVLGGGHVVPQPYRRFPSLLGPQTGDLNAPAALWDFFATIPATD